MKNHRKSSSDDSSRARRYIPRRIGYHRFAPRRESLSRVAASRSESRRECAQRFKFVKFQNFLRHSADCTRLLAPARCPCRRSSLFFLFSTNGARCTRLSVQSPTAARPRENRATTEQDLRNVNDPSAGSPTETLLRLLLPLDNVVRSNFRSKSAR